eukprot:CAMPEP_0175085242 /NCGR_PEP_ID=MMETSP0052_2-20121109/28544_1 /TAXON_ID=51329 ORGANISM="Polytomella parva, Strain SAG 63-3" /NCGR_SAMPLE_ID=MMETSP0052_2 /ASSEMBLY_ACC=CAM_ASM_000194 /LENGTH=1496 /DNA_ID=CAMNT_0016357211 /DNA_START=31 /DNA_END=4522 /DNA_ORIENTATION=+
MGIKHLWSLFGDFTNEITGDIPKILKILEDKVLAVDLSIWILEATKQEELNKVYAADAAILKTVFERSCQLLRFGCLPVFILDGEACFEKYETICRRLQASSLASSSYCVGPDYLNDDTAKSGVRNGLKSVSQPRKRLRMYYSLITPLLDAMGLPWVQAPGEAEAMAAALAVLGGVDIVLTADSDAALFGAPFIIRSMKLNFSHASDCSLTLVNVTAAVQHLFFGRDVSSKTNNQGRDPDVCISKEHIINNNRTIFTSHTPPIGSEALIALSLFTGGDFDSSGLKGVGSKGSACAIAALLAGQENDYCIMPLLWEAFRREKVPGIFSEDTFPKPMGSLLNCFPPSSSASDYPSASSSSSFSPSAALNAVYDAYGEKLVNDDSDECLTTSHSKPKAPSKVWHPPSRCTGCHACGHESGTAGTCMRHPFSRSCKICDELDRFEVMSSNSLNTCPRIPDSKFESVAGFDPPCCRRVLAMVNEEMKQKRSTKQGLKSGEVEDKEKEGKEEGNGGHDCKKKIEVSMKESANDKNIKNYTNNANYLTSTSISNFSSFVSSRPLKPSSLPTSNPPCQCRFHRVHNLVILHRVLKAAAESRNFGSQIKESLNAYRRQRQQAFDDAAKVIETARGETGDWIQKWRKERNGEKRQEECTKEERGVVCKSNGKGILQEGVFKWKHRPRFHDVLVALECPVSRRFGKNEYNGDAHSNLFLPPCSSTSSSQSSPSPTSSPPPSLSSSSSLTSSSSSPPIYISRMRWSVLDVRTKMVPIFLLWDSIYGSKTLMENADMDGNGDRITVEFKPILVKDSHYVTETAKANSIRNNNCEASYSHRLSNHSFKSSNDTNKILTSNGQNSYMSSLSPLPPSLSPSPSYYYLVVFQRETYDKLLKSASTFPEGFDSTWMSYAELIKCDEEVLGSKSKTTMRHVRRSVIDQLWHELVDSMKNLKEKKHQKVKKIESIPIRINKGKGTNGKNASLLKNCNRKITSYFSTINAESQLHLRKVNSEKCNQDVFNIHGCSVECNFQNNSLTKEDEGKKQEKGKGKTERKIESEDANEVEKMQEIQKPIDLFIKPSCLSTQKSENKLDNFIVNSSKTKELTFEARLRARLIQSEKQSDAALNQVKAHRSSGSFDLVIMDISPCSASVCKKDINILSHSPLHPYVRPVIPPSLHPLPSTPPLTSFLSSSPLTTPSRTTFSLSPTTPINRVQTEGRKGCGEGEGEGEDLEDSIKHLTHAAQRLSVSASDKRERRRQEETEKMGNEFEGNRKPPNDDTGDNNGNGNGGDVIESHGFISSNLPNCGIRIQSSPPLPSSPMVISIENTPSPSRLMWPFPVVTTPTSQRSTRFHHPILPVPYCREQFMNVLLDSSDNPCGINNADSKSTFNKQIVNTEYDLAKTFRLITHMNNDDDKGQRKEDEGQGGELSSPLPNFSIFPITAKHLLRQANSPPSSIRCFNRQFETPAHSIMDLNSPNTPESVVFVPDSTSLSDLNISPMSIVFIDDN